MSPKSLTSRPSIDSCLFQLHSWKPFSNPSKTLDPDPNPNPNPKSTNFHSKRQCLSDRTTSLFSLSIDTIDFSKLSLFDDGGVPRNHQHHHQQQQQHHQSRLEKLRWSMARKRRRKGGSRSVSGRSSDRSGTRNGGCRSVAATATATATCSDFMVANGGTDSSGELFGNNVNGWASDVSEARRENGGNVGGEVGVGGVGVGFGFEGGGNESGYGSEPGYRGDVEYGYGDEVDDEEEEGARLLMLWGQTLGGTPDSKMEMVGENSFSELKTHHRGRRKKHDWRMVDSVR
ncbi:uncharacterized protein LOC141637878 [Silene latifolia]|uniref:uncharacterized protein LOC141637878 n=1 Tax=Silene latifolia TaxID=37657 RepID=UPI003D7743A2